MGGQETFAVYKPQEDGVLWAHVFVSTSVLDWYGAHFDATGLMILDSPYVAGGPDQTRVLGPWAVLGPALAERPLRIAARRFAVQVMSSRTRYSRFHDVDLAGRVLGLS